MAAAAVASSSTPRPLRLAPRWALGGAPDHANAPTLRSRRPQLAVSAAAGAEAGGSERFYFNFTGFPFPLGPFLNRRTIRTEVTSPLSLSPAGSLAIFLLRPPSRRPETPPEKVPSRSSISLGWCAPAVGRVRR